MKAFHDNPITRMHYIELLTKNKPGLYRKDYGLSQITKQNCIETLYQYESTRNVNKPNYYNNLYGYQSPWYSYEIELGIPAWFGCLEDYIFTYLPEEEARTWPKKLLTKILPSQNLENTYLKIVETISNKINGSDEIIDIKNKVLNRLKFNSDDEKENKELYKLLTNLIKKYKDKKETQDKFLAIQFILSGNLCVALNLILTTEEEYSILSNELLNIIGE